MDRRKKPRIVFLDTHIIVWLYFGLVKKLSNKEKQAIEDYDLYASPIAMLETQYLFETKKINIDANTVFSFLKNSIGLEVSTLDFISIAQAALKLNWTRDVFDRIIVAEALLGNAHLLSHDRLIRRYYPNTIH